MQQYTFGQFLKKFWYVYMLGVVRIYAGIQQGRYDFTVITLGLGLALVLNYGAFLAWRAWKLRKGRQNRSVTLRTAYKSELDGLLNAGLPLAQQLLAKHGGFQPFEASLDASGKIALGAAMPSIE